MGTMKNIARLTPLGMTANVVGTLIKATDPTMQQRAMQEGIENSPIGAAKDMANDVVETTKKTVKTAVTEPEKTKSSMFELAGTAAKTAATVGIGVMSWSDPQPSSFETGLKDFEQKTQEMDEQNQEAIERLSPAQQQMPEPELQQPQL